MYSCEFGGRCSLVTDTATTYEWCQRKGGETLPEADVVMCSRVHLWKTSSQERKKILKGKGDCNVM